MTAYSHISETRLADARHNVSATDEVFEYLYRSIVVLDLLPGSKISEADIAAKLEVSRQPVRDAFFRLSELDFLRIRPQRATIVAKISADRLAQAAFLRSAIEIACLKELIGQNSPDNLSVLKASLEAQSHALDAENNAEFHRLDDEFHFLICHLSGHKHAWSFIEEQKAHIDRVRFLTLTSGHNSAYQEHVDIYQAISDSDSARAEQILRQHLLRISDALDLLRRDHAAYFEDSK